MVNIEGCQSGNYGGANLVIVWGCQCGHRGGAKVVIAYITDFLSPKKTFLSPTRFAVANPGERGFLMKTLKTADQRQKGIL